MAAGHFGFIFELKSFSEWPLKHVCNKRFYPSLQSESCFFTSVLCGVRSLNVFEDQDLFLLKFQLAHTFQYFHSHVISPIQVKLGSLKSYHIYECVSTLQKKHLYCQSSDKRTNIWTGTRGQSRIEERERRERRLNIMSAESRYSG